MVQEDILFKYISYLYGSPFVQQSGIICEILVEGIMSNISVKLFRI